MKKSFLIVILGVMVLNVTGCGSCRNLFGFRNRACATPMIGTVQPYSPTYCAPACMPACPPTCCDPCADGTSVTYGYSGGEVMMPGAEVGVPMTDGACNCQ